MTQTLAIACDHGGFELKQAIKHAIHTVNWHDLGTDSHDRVDYPTYANALCDYILKTPHALGILICGTGIGISIRANRFHGIRAAVVHNEFTAKMAKEHNNANVLCLGGRILNSDTATACIHTWLNAHFDGGRHTTRIRRLDD